MIDQLRIYVVRDEMWDEWIGFFRSVIAPLHEAHGIPIVAAWREVAPPQTHLTGDPTPVPEGCTRFLWVRRFRSLDSIEEQERAYATSPERVAAGYDIPRRAFVAGQYSNTEPLLT